MNWRLLFWSAIAVFVTTLAIIAIILLSGGKFSLSLRSATVSGNAASYTVEVEADAEWVVVTESGNWCYVTPYTGGKGRTNVTLAVDANPAAEERELKVVFYSGNDAKVFVLKQQAGLAQRVQPVPPSLPESAVEPVKPSKPVPQAKPQPPRVAKPKPVAAAKPKPKQAPPQKTVKPKPSASVTKAKQAPVKQETAGKVLIQENVLKEEKNSVDPARADKEELPVKYIADGPCKPVTVHRLQSSATVICEGEGVVFSLPNSQTAVSYELFRNGKSISGFVPGTGGELIFPSRCTEAGVYTAKSVAATQYCITEMAGSITLTLADKFTPGKIEVYSTTLDRGATPPLIKSLEPARGGDGHIGYRWTVNGRFIEGATGETYQPKPLSYNATYARLSHDESCSTGWTQSAGEVVVSVKP